MKPRNTADDRRQSTRKQFQSAHVAPQKLIANFGENVLKIVKRQGNLKFNAMKPTDLSTTITILLAMLAPVLWLVVAILWEDRRRSKIEMPPQTEKLLRPPGYSLSVQLDDITMTAIFYWLAAMWLGAASGWIALVTYHSLILHAPAWFCSVWFLLFVLFALACVMMTIRAFRRFRESRKILLGLHGEQAVAEALNEAAEFGFRSFHDLPAEEHWNIDHVAVGTRGVFLIETKARTRRATNRGGQPPHEVIYDGRYLQFPSFKTDEPIEQAKRNAKWLSNFLEKKTGSPVWVEPLVVLPGWFVQNSEKGNFPVTAMNTTYLPGFLQRKGENVDRAQVRRIITALDEKCRDVKF